jgi:hypothetical protein
MSPACCSAHSIRYAKAHAAFIAVLAAMGIAVTTTGVIFVKIVIGHGESKQAAVMLAKEIARPGSA